MPLDTGDVTIGLDGVATGTGLAKLLYDALADEHDAFPNQLPAPNTPGAQESLAKLARAIAAPIAIAVNEGVEVTANPGQVLGNELDAGTPNVAHPLTPAELNAIVGSIALHLTQYLGFGSNPAGVPVGDIRGDGPFAIVGNGTVELGSLGAGGVAITAVAGPGSLHGTSLDLEATAGAAEIAASAGIDLSPGANQPVRIDSGLIRLIERAAGVALAAGQALFFAKNDAPNNPYFRDDTNVDRKLLTAPAALTDFATQAEGTVLLRALGAGAGVPSAGSGSQVGQLARFDFFQNFSLAPGVQTLTLDARTCIAFISPSAPGDVIIDQIVHGSSNTGARVLIVKQQTTGRVLLRDGNASANSLWTPGSVDFALTAYNDSVLITHSGTRWFLDTREHAVLTERAAGLTVAAGQAVFFAKNDTPNNPYFRDDTNVDRKIVTAPVPLADMATMAQGTALGRTALGGTGVPIALSGLQQGENLRRGTFATDAASTGVVATYTLTADLCQVLFSGSGSLTLHGATATAATFGKTVEWAVDAGAAVIVDFVNESGSAGASGERFRTPGGVPYRLKAGDCCQTTYWANRHRFIGVPASGPVLVEEATPQTLAPGQAKFFAKNDAPNNPYFRDDTNVDRKILTAPAPNADIAGGGLGTTKGVPLNGVAGTLTDLSGFQQVQNLRWNLLLDTTSTGTIVSYAPTGYVSGLVNYIRCTPAGPVIVRGMALPANAMLVFRIGRSAAAANTFTFNHEDALATAGEQFNTPGNVPLTLRAGEGAILYNSEARVNVVAIGRDQFDYLKLVERAAGDTLAAGQAQFFARNDTPNTPMFRDDTNVDHKLVRAPVPLADMATMAQGTAVGRAVLTGTGVPGALTGLQQGQNLRRATSITDALTTGVVATYTLTEDLTQVIFTGSGTIQLEGATIIAGKEITWTVDVNATVVVTFMNDGAPTITQERFRTHTQRQVTIRAGESVTTCHFFNRHRFVSVSKRADPQITSVVREDFDGQCDAAGVLARSPWIAWDSPTIAQADTATSGYHSSNHPGILHMQDDAALADECAIYRGPYDFANIATFGATIMIPADGGNELLNCAMGFGIVSDPTDMDVSTSGGVWTDNNLVFLHRSGGASAGNWLVRRENAGSGAAVSSGVTVVAGTWATFRAEQTTPGSGSWRCYINGTLFTTATLANTSGIAYLAIGMIRGAGAAGRNLLVDEIILDTFELNRAAA
jgi:hypothetical protein